ncbi:CDK-activating kinase assembly factor MAT1-like [Coregonus clupeaformis]|uniref:CDK-activating kinase assembly factor MAT1-like n=1 Tax=Coregonus clupeaformis TaxID=59861 RepID=UPI001BE0EC13|nr:CDK-activating kinase assembly factor MAT1-like [Coregonus clupeaformis]
MVNVCGHTLCESCVDMLFVRGSGTCVQCGTPLRKSNFHMQLFEDPAVDKEVEIRKKVLKERSHVPATILLAEHKDRAAQLETQIEKQKQVVKTTIFSTGIPISQTVSLQPVARIEEVLYRYQPIIIHTYGPTVPELEQLGRLGYLNPRT